MGHLNNSLTDKKKLKVEEKCRKWRKGMNVLLCVVHTIDNQTHIFSGRN